jgi:catechol 2,3-dioxygenase-like lactoylglutathione lyase family enzyme
VDAGPAATAISRRGAAVVDYKLEVVVIPVADVDRAKNFYKALGWREDADFAREDFRVVQLTPPGSPDGNEWFVQEITTRLPGR